MKMDLPFKDLLRQIRQALKAVFDEFVEQKKKSNYYKWSDEELRIGITQFINYIDIKWSLGIRLSQVSYLQ